MLSTSRHLPIVTAMPVIVPASARTLAQLALAHGMEVEEAFTAAGAWCVEGIHRELGVGFRAYWRDGAAAGASWHEARVEYREVAAPAEALQGRGGDRGVRATGYVDGTRLEPVASPWGVWMGVTAVTARVKALQ